MGATLGRPGDDKADKKWDFGVAMPNLKGGIGIRPVSGRAKIQIDLSDKPTETVPEASSFLLLVTSLVSIIGLELKPTQSRVKGQFKRMLRFL